MAGERLGKRDKISDDPTTRERFCRPTQIPDDVRRPPRDSVRRIMIKNPRKEKTPPLTLGIPLPGHT